MSLSLRLSFFSFFVSFSLLFFIFLLRFQFSSFSLHASKKKKSFDHAYIISLGLLLFLYCTNYFSLPFIWFSSSLQSFFFLYFPFPKFSRLLFSKFVPRLLPFQSICNRCLFFLSAPPNSIKSISRHSLLKITLRVQVTPKQLRLSFPT